MNSPLNLTINPGKQEIVEFKSKKYSCYAIKTRVIKDGDDLRQVIDEYAKPALDSGDVLFISEKMISCTQGRAIPIKDIKPGFLARTLSRFVTKSPHGIGLAMPETMQCAIDECGRLRILLAAAAGAIGKLFRQKGWFYHVAGRQAAGIDGPCDYTLPPYNEYVVLGPRNPSKIAAEISQLLNGTTVLVVDLNDLGGEILGSSDPGIDSELMLGLLRQNPLGQSSECTPMGILRAAV